MREKAKSELAECQKERQREYDLRCKLAGQVETLLLALGNLLDTSAVIKSDNDFTEITCVNAHYKRAYDVLNAFERESRG